MATYLSFTPFVGLDYVIIMYSGVVLGGMGSILGAFWGGLLVGFVQQVSALFLSPQLQNAAIFVVFLLIEVALRPEGLSAARRSARAQRRCACMRVGGAARLRRDIVALTVISVVYAALAASVHNSYYQLILTLVPIWAILGLGWNLFSGMSGLVSFGHASFFGIGAYTVTLSLVYWRLTPWLGIPLGMVVGCVAAVLIGLPTFRLRGHYFALSMLAYPLAILYVLQYLGFQEVPLPMHREHPALFLQFTKPLFSTLVALGFFIAAMIVGMLVENSRFGLALLAIKQNELAAEAAGIDTRRWKMRALVASGALSAAAGGLYAWSCC